jgi:hypothetical protein
MEVFDRDLPGFGVLLAGIALYNVYECVPVVNIRPGFHASLRLAPYSEAFIWNPDIYLILVYTGIY